MYLLIFTEYTRNMPWTASAFTCSQASILRWLRFRWTTRAWSSHCGCARPADLNARERWSPARDWLTNVMIACRTRRARSASARSRRPTTAARRAPSSCTTSARATRSRSSRTGCRSSRRSRRGPTSSRCSSATRCVLAFARLCYEYEYCLPVTSWPPSDSATFTSARRADGPRVRAAGHLGRGLQIRTPPPHAVHRGLRQNLRRCSPRVRGTHTKGVPYTQNITLPYRQNITLLTSVATPEPGHWFP